MSEKLFPLSNLTYTSVMRHATTKNRENHYGLFLSSPVQLAYESIDASSYGEELPPLVILHGLFGSKTNWKTLGKHFHRETGRKVLIFSLHCADFIWLKVNYVFLFFFLFHFATDCNS